MIVLPPIAISDLNLTSSTISEPNAPADYNAGTTYAKGDFVTDATYKIVYQSLAASNTGNTPSSSPTWWEMVGYKEVAWASGTTYGASTAASPVYVYYLHRIYESLQGSNTGNSPIAHPEYWEDIGPSLRYAMFDTLRNTATVGASPITAVITPGVRVNAAAVLGVVADSVRLQMTSAGASVYDETASLVSRTAFDWYEYFFKTFSQSNSYLFRDLPPYSNGVITATFTRASGNVEVGALCIGTELDLGITQKSAENDTRNFSTIDFDDFGNAVLTQRRAVPKTNQTVLADSANLPDILAARVALNAVPAVWAGLTDNTGDYFPSLLILGVYTQFKITPQPPDKAVLTLELQEV